MIALLGLEKGDHLIYHLEHFESERMLLIIIPGVPGINLDSPG